MTVWTRRAAASVVMMGVLALLAACGTVSDPAARVNGEPISRLELQRETDRFAGRLQAAGPGQMPPVAVLRAQTLDRLIALRLLRQQARQEGIVVAPAEIDARIAQLIEMNGGKAPFLALLQDEDLTSGDMRRTVEDQILAERLTARHVPAPTVVDERRVRHVLVDSADKAAAARQRLASGETWEKVAAELSADPGSRGRGGDLGFIQRGQTVPPFDAAAFALPVNEISQPVQTTFGHHVLQVTEARAQAPTADQASAIQQRQFSQFLTQLRERAAIEVSGGAPAAPAAPVKP
jgi:parvulin-like peptidyl-prolyl isomerase